MKNPRLCTYARSSDSGFDWPDLCCVPRCPALEVAGTREVSPVWTTWIECYYQKKGNQTCDKRKLAVVTCWWQRVKKINVFMALYGKCFFWIFLFSSVSIFNHLISPWILPLHCCLQLPLLSLLLPWYGLSLSLSWTTLEHHLTDPALTLSQHLNLNLALEDASSPHTSQCPLGYRSRWQVYDRENWLQVCSRAS